VRWAESCCRVEGYSSTVLGSLLSGEQLSGGHVLYPSVAAEAGMQDLRGKKEGRQEETSNKSLGGRAVSQEREDT